MSVSLPDSQFTGTVASRSNSLALLLRDFRSSLNGAERDRDAVLPYTPTEAPTATAPVEPAAAVHPTTPTEPPAPVEHAEAEHVETGVPVETPEHVS